jgi:hypothetical protein
MRVNGTCGRGHSYSVEEGVVYTSAITGRLVPACSECCYLLYVARSNGFELMQLPWLWTLSATRVRKAASLIKHLGRSPNHISDIHGFELFARSADSILSSHSPAELPGSEEINMIEVLARD